MTASTSLLLTSTLFVVIVVEAKIHFYEPFDTADRWVKNHNRSDLGVFTLTTGDFFGDAKINQGYTTMEVWGIHSYASWAKIDPPVPYEGTNLVVSFSVKDLGNADGYIKLMTDRPPSHTESDYWLLLFGPQQRSNHDNRVRLVFNSNGRYLHWKKVIRCPYDMLTHVYTLVLKGTTNTYEMYIDQELKASGKLADHWSFSQPQEIDDYVTRKPLTHVSIEVRQLTSAIFDNIVIGDDLAEVNALVDTTWKATRDAEKAALAAMCNASRTTIHKNVTGPLKSDNTEL